MSDTYTKQIQNITTGIVVVDPDTDDILEFVGYWDEIDRSSIQQLAQECDERYGADKYVLYFATDEMIEHFKLSELEPL